MTPSTKDNILDAAERLFAEHGFEATSLRMITAEAGANLAAVNYHFQSKDALIDAVVGRRAAIINRKRLEMLDACEAAAGDGRLPLEPVLEAFLAPVLEVTAEAQAFGPLMGRLHYAEPSHYFEAIFKKHLSHVVARFIAAMRRALPDLPPDELFWRVRFIVGAMANVVINAHRLNIFPGQPETIDKKDVLPRLLSFAAAGLRAPYLAAKRAGASRRNGEP